MTLEKEESLAVWCNHDFKIYATPNIGGCAVNVSIFDYNNKLIGDGTHYSEIDDFSIYKHIVYIISNEIFSRDNHNR